MEWWSQTLDRSGFKSDGELKTRADEYRQYFKIYINECESNIVTDTYCIIHAWILRAPDKVPPEF